MNHENNNEVYKAKMRSSNQHYIADQLSAIKPKSNER